MIPGARLGRVIKRSWIPGRDLHELPNADQAPVLAQLNILLRRAGLIWPVHQNVRHKKTKCSTLAAQIGLELLGQFV